MKLRELITHAQAGRIESLDLVSIEGGIYLLNAHMDGRIHGLHDECDKAMRLRSVEHARYLLEQAPDVPLYLSMPAPTTRCAASVRDDASRCVC